MGLAWCWQHSQWVTISAPRPAAELQGQRRLPPVQPVCFSAQSKALLELEELLLLKEPCFSWRK